MAVVGNDNGYGYLHISLYNLNTKKPGREYIHRLVAMEYIANPENKPCVNHIDGNKRNNHYKNLEWATYQENSIHAKDVLKIKYGRHIRGERNHTNKLTEKQVLFILENPDLKTKKELAKQFGVTQPSIYRIVKGLSWKHIKR